MHGNDGKESAVQLNINWMKNNMESSKESKSICLGISIYENDTIAEHIGISYSLVLSLVSKTEK